MHSGILLKSKTVRVPRTMSGNSKCALQSAMSQIPGSETAPASPEYLKSGQHNKLKNRTKHDFQFPFKELTNQKQKTRFERQHQMKFGKIPTLKNHQNKLPGLPRDASDEQKLKSPKNWNV